MEIPVYFFTGFLESGKTSFIESILKDPNFAEGERTLLLMCEDGEVEYDYELLRDTNCVLKLVENQEDFSNDALFELLKGYASQKGYKNGYVMWPVRTAVSGKQNTPGGATELMEVLGKEESLLRIRNAVEKLMNETE